MARRSGAALCWVLPRLSHTGHKPRQNFGHLQFGDWLRQTLPPWAAEDCTKRVWGGHFGILTPYVCLINASGPEFCFASLPSPLRGAQRKYLKRQYSHVISLKYSKFRKQQNVNHVANANCNSSYLCVCAPRYVMTCSHITRCHFLHSKYIH